MDTQHLKQNVSREHDTNTHTHRYQFSQSALLRITFVYLFICFVLFLNLVHARVKCAMQFVHFGISYHTSKFAVRKKKTRASTNRPKGEEKKNEKRVIRLKLVCTVNLSSRISNHREISPIFAFNGTIYVKRLQNELYNSYFALSNMFSFLSVSRVLSFGLMTSYDTLSHHICCER